MTSIIFPGQGSQSINMAKDFHDNFKSAREIFEKIEDYTKIQIRTIIFENQDNKLDLTQFTQICIFSASYVIFKTYAEEVNLNIKEINVMMGHSLGEYTALVCSNKINLEDCSLLLKKRGELMNNAVEPNKTGMAALIGKDCDFIQKIIEDNKLELEIANDNSPIQIVISGNINEIINSKDIFIKNNVKKFINLNVSAAFHSTFMNEAQQKLNKEIETTNFKDNAIKIISNYDGKVYTKSNLIKDNLKKQMANKVNWTQSIKNLEYIGENKILEIGPGKVLSGLINRISKKFDIKSINQVSDI